ncbi:HIT family protein [Pararobbsia silviterrae]|uniref:HIT family protein n=1 Tax=Pararobbsia silviterrae TaxID=1792498 RepID=A0A494Y878_9BURK|nr:HIT family protein [Pararobbsia silviterrae]RKP58901.1 HIT family protein [Pararobbsia silviterrae]
MSCVFCDTDGGTVLWRDAALRVVLADEPGYPGFCRVIANPHVAEFSDLDAPSRAHLMETVAAVERAVRHVMKPGKVNLASLGNQVPHVHWHVIPRYADDAHFPKPIWASPERDVAEARIHEREALSMGLRDAVAREMQGVAAARRPG